MRYQPVQLAESFSKFLTKALGSYFISLCNCNKELSDYRGGYIYNLVEIIPEEVDFIKNELYMKHPIERFYNALYT